MDFTIKTYQNLLHAFIRAGYSFQTYADFLERPAPRTIILRHDVEARYENALQFARIQHELGIAGTYYFRFLPNHFSKDIIREIASLGHEIGYHYDDLSHCHGNYEEALKRFEKNLATLREIAPVTTICMEGAPLSKWDNREMWREPQAASRKPQALSSLPYAHYRDFGIVGEPYFDLDFSKVLYLTDTGRMWDGEKVSVRDRANSKFHPPAGGQNSKFHSTRDIISAASAGLLPDQIMFTFHPQRWTDKPLPWVKELVMQRVKNVVKRVVVKW
jgi:hypothetical protein